MKYSICIFVLFINCLTCFAEIPKFTFIIDDEIVIGLGNPIDPLIEKLGPPDEYGESYNNSINLTRSYNIFDELLKFFYIPENRVISYLETQSEMIITSLGFKVGSSRSELLSLGNKIPVREDGRYIIFSRYIIDEITMHIIGENFIFELDEKNRFSKIILSYTDNNSFTL